jgi:hypothetical protein
VPLAEREGLRALDEAARPLGVFFNVHVFFLSHAGCPVSAAWPVAPKC